MDMKVLRSGHLLKERESLFVNRILNILGDPYHWIIFDSLKNIYISLI